MSQFSKGVLTSMEESVIAALAKLEPDTSLPVTGKLVTSKDLQAQIQAHVDAMKSADDARAKVSQFVALDRSLRANLALVLSGIRSYAAGRYGELSPEFASFGFKPKKTPQRTVASKAGAVEKLRATRVARHTMGKRQRAAIHGVVPTPVNPPPAVTSPAAAPANTGGNGALTASVTNGVSH
jgi:hypothetical protein